MTNRRSLHFDRFNEWSLVYGDSEEERQKAIDQQRPGMGYVFSIHQQWEADGLFFAYVSQSRSCD